MWAAPCPMHAATGWFCAGCGGTRAVGELLRGDLLGAADANAALVVVVPVAAAYLGITRRWSGTGLARFDGFWMLLAVLLGWTVLRNLPGLDVLRSPES